MAAIDVHGPCPEWCPAAHRGELDGRAVWIRIGPAVTPNELAQHRGQIEAIDHAHAVPPLAIVPVGDRTAWVYPELDGVGLQHLCNESFQLPVGAAAEVVATAASVVAARQAPAVVDAADVVLLRSGELRVLGATERPRPIADPLGPNRSNDVYALGLLLARLLTGYPFKGQVKASSHDAALRRMLITVMTRPGPVFSEEYRNYLTHMLSHQPDVRPTASRVASGLATLAESHPGVSLATWCEEGFERALRRAHSHYTPTPAPAPADYKPRVSGTWDDTLTPADLDDDDHTALSQGNPSSTRLAMEHGAMPVRVGPPPEAIGAPPTLPIEIFADTSSANEVVDGVPRYLVLTGGVLAAAALLLSAYLFVL